MDDKLDLALLSTENELEAVIPGLGFHSHLKGGTYYVTICPLIHYCFRKQAHFISSYDN